MLLQRKIGIVSGVGPGIGRSIALAFAREGADVALAARSEETLREVAREVEALGRRAIAVPTDITEPDDCRRLAEATQSAFGRIDVLVNNAFTARPVVAFADSDLSDWRQAMEVNYWGSLNLTHAVVPFMRELDDARVIMINASASRVAGVGYGAYCGSKAGLLGATRVLAKELGAQGVRVNSVLPSATDTPSLRGYFDDLAAERGADPQALFDDAAGLNALGYIPPADEVAGAVVFFASPLARAVTGQVLHADAGFWLD
jgi:NAD(P)-dependent dehydrogenase (short-subunit alcohol dehydrogenase family)